MYHKSGQARQAALGSTALPVIIRDVALPWNDILFYAIDLSTFSSIWYWLAVAVTWGTVSHWILGVPFDMVLYSHRYGAQATEDLEKMVEINVRRLTSIMDTAGFWIVGLSAFLLAGLASMGFIYTLEIAQGIFLLGFPLIFVAMINLRLARQFQHHMPTGKALSSRLFRVRIWIQSIAVVSIFLIAAYGMYFTMSVPVGF